LKLISIKKPSNDCSSFGSFYVFANKLLTELIGLNVKTNYI